MVGELFGESIEGHIVKHRLNRNLSAAVKRATIEFSNVYNPLDKELVTALTQNTRFDDIDTVAEALTEMLKNPLRSPTEQVHILRRAFTDVLPVGIADQRVAGALSSYLDCLGREVLNVPELQDLYSLLFQKDTAESTRKTAKHTEMLVEQVSDLNHSIRNMPQQLASSQTSGYLTDDLLSASLLRVKHNLPKRNYFEFVGRENELMQLLDLLKPYPASRHFVVTIDGIGGVGKTSLALEVAHQALDISIRSPENGESFKAIVWVTAKRDILTSGGIEPRQHNFSTLSDLFREIATVHEQKDILKSSLVEQRAQVGNLLTKERTLLLIDNLETVQDSELLSFLRELPDPTKAIVTTRHRIDVAYSLRITGLSEIHTKELIGIEATQREIELENNQLSEFIETTAGIPLAIVWTLSLIKRGHQSKYAIERLKHGTSDIARFCFDESIETISGMDAYNVLLSLSLFDANVTLNMLRRVTELENEFSLDDAIADLIQLSLINQEKNFYSMLPLTRSYVYEQFLKETELAIKIRRTWVKVLFDYSDNFNQIRWRWFDLSELHEEGEHVVTLAAWAEENDRPDIFLGTASALNFYYNFTGQWLEKKEMLTKGIEYARLLGDQDMLFIISRHLSGLYSETGEYTKALPNIEYAYSLSLRQNCVDKQIKALISWSSILRREEKFEEAQDRCTETEALILTLPLDIQWQANASLLYEKGRIFRDQEEWEQARHALIQARDVFGYDAITGEFDIRRAWGVLGNLGVVEYALGNYDEARLIYEQCIAHIRISGGKGGLATLLTRLAQLEEQCGNFSIALEHINEAMAISQQLNLAKEIELAEQIYQRLILTKANG